MEMITVPLTSGTTRNPECLNLHGQRMLVGPADTGIFRIVDVGARPENLKSAPSTRGDEDGLALATIEIDGALEVGDLNTGGDPYNRHGRKTR